MPTPADALLAPAQALADAGQLEAAIAAATVALASNRLTPEAQMALLALRFDCHETRLELGAALADADAMAGLAQRHEAPHEAPHETPHKAQQLQALAALCAASVNRRLGKSVEAIAAGQAALNAARLSGLVLLEARALERLSDVGRSTGAAAAQAMARATQALALYESLGDLRGQARVRLRQFALLAGSGRTVNADQAAVQALALARQGGALREEAQALNCLTWHVEDPALRLQRLHQALTLAQAAGDVGGQQAVINNLANCYAGLGLARRALRLFDQAHAVATRAGARSTLRILSWNMTLVEIDLGQVERARAHAADWEAGMDSSPRRVAYGSYLAGCISLMEGQPAQAAKQLTLAVRHADASDAPGLMSSLIEFSRACLATGRTAAALRATRRAVRLHQASDLAARADVSHAEIWWRHSQALQACGLEAKAHEALARAYGFVLESIKSLSDEGLRRTTLNKPQATREIIGAWLKAARAQPPELRQQRQQHASHLAGAADLKQPFERLVDTGLRLNEIKSEAELCECLVDEVTELSGADRVLLVLDAAGQGRIAGSLLPRGESDAALLAAITPWLAEARRTRATSLRHGPEGAEPIGQRSCLVVPLLAQRELLGFIYVDIDGAFGRFHDGDTQLLTLLAAQAAVTLVNLRAAEALERQVEERTAEARAAQAEAEQRAGELAVIASIQQGMASALGFQAIIDLVGDTQRKVFGSDEVCIRWWDEAANLIHYLYEFERGERLHLPPATPKPGGAFLTLARTRQPMVLGNVAAMMAAGIQLIDGTQQSLSMVGVPIIGIDRVLGFVVIENYEREDAFSEAEVRLLQTIAASMGAALENARLFNETQTALARQTASADILRVISQSPTDMQPVFEVIVTTALRLLGCDMAAVALCTGNTYRTPALATSAGLTPDMGGTTRPIDPQVDFPSQVFVSKAMLHLPDWSVIELPAYEHSVRSRQGIEASLMLPLLRGGECIGAIVMARRKPGAFTPDEIALAESFVDQAVIAIENVRLFSERSEERRVGKECA